MKIDVINAELNMMTKEGEILKLHHHATGDYETIGNELSKWANRHYKQRKGVFAYCKCWNEKGYEEKGYNFKITYDSTK